jgi:tetratricopeptide (TPR) repeat protein
MSLSQAPAQPSAADTPPGYQLLDEVGHGGMGVVWRAHDLSLNREVAIKFLKPERAGDAAAAERFVTESRITGQLQHPGIPAVHELGTLPDGRPFLAMKLVRGRTLHDLLKSRDCEATGATERGRFIAIFEQVCHAVGYAHAHKVIHRDLKPSNVMVGEFGEVQVMDWGLAKVLADPASYERERGEEDPDATVGLVTAIDTPERDDAATRTGSVLGTPAYMPPEQAGGEIRKLDARSDVFGLGAILCQILTGRPPYHGSDANEIRLQAVRWEVGEAFAALDSCGAEPELVALCKRCLAKEQAERPADGRAVAQEVARIRQAAEERARQAELQRAEALVRAAEQAKRRRLAVLLGGAIAAVLLVGLAVSLWQMERAIDAEQQATANAEEAERNAAEARAERDAKEQERQRAEAALAAETRARAAERQARDQAMAALRMMTDELVEHQLARNPTLTEENKEFLRKVIKHFEGFAAITANDADSRSIRAEGYFRVGRMRHRLGDLKDAEAAYRDALALRKQLAADFPTRPDYRQELAGSHHNLGVLLYQTGRPKEAEAAYRDALTLQKQLAADFPNQPDMQNDLAGTLVNLASLCNQQRDYAAAKGYLDEALPHHQAALKANPRHPTYRQFYRNHLWTLAQAQAGLLDRAAAVKAAEQIRDLGWNPADDAYHAACALALCIPIVAKHEKLDADERQAAVQFYGDEAMKLLGDAVSKGFKDAGRIRAESDLAPLRNRDDFQKLLAELEAQPDKPPAQDGKSK